MSRHPNQERLALFASGDLGRLARWTVERHLRQKIARRPGALILELQVLGRGPVGGLGSG